MEFAKLLTISVTAGKLSMDLVKGLKAPRKARLLLFFMHPLDSSSTCRKVFRCSFFESACLAGPTSFKANSGDEPSVMRIS
ncbi:predicted protein [Sclerotinia sclerotiorum 1980 UF-70]|uniref:Uncharacterized protein n=1 Tax=Sclerotinia sclerotiorum (strain ATCC 18683 / 1980 / Ss-1) TaxID=665079 RepID=A7ETR4_SCLS1|nr:predicted protein [Sclerotinia sclerotiorum 1980 UF-70]EDN92856.1 predicted protein [Sclerotinia sclerotiorum 1980 UF-70]